MQRNHTSHFRPIPQRNLAAGTHSYVNIKPGHTGNNNNRGADQGGRLTIKSISAIAGAIFAGAVLIVFSSEIAEGITEGLKSSFELLVPSLFPFMVFSSFLIRSGISEKAGYLMSWIAKHFLRLPPEAGSAVVLGLTGGFPVGAKCVSLLYEKGRVSQRQAEQLMLFCVCAGPSFLVTGVGVMLTGSFISGMILYLSQVVSALILGFVSGRIYSPRKHRRISGKSEISDRSLNEVQPIYSQSNNTVIPLRYAQSSENAHSAKTTKRLSDAFIQSCSDGCNSMLMMCALIALFTALIQVLHSLGTDNALSSALEYFGMDSRIADNAFYIIAEVSGACKKTVLSGCPLYITAFASGFGGLCVHIQVFAFLGNIRISRLRYFIFRIINAFLSSAIVYIICGIYDPAVETAAAVGFSHSGSGSAAIVGTAALAVMCMIFVLSLKKSSLGRPLKFIRKTGGSYVRYSRMV